MPQAQCRGTAGLAQTFPSTDAYTSFLPFHSQSNLGTFCSNFGKYRYHMVFYVFRKESKP